MAHGDPLMSGQNRGIQRSADKIPSPRCRDRRGEGRRGSERRVFQRAHRVLPVWYRHEGRFRRGCALDIAVEGACLITEVGFEPGDQFELSIQVETDWEVRSTATVLWKDSAPDGVTHMLGVKFRPLRAADRHLLGPWIHSAVAQDREVRSGTPSR
ncbi:MAG: PilZ domain-containing protein [Candidatus Eremiobacterota bacterium]